ncbi:MAG: MvaI/BcnI restriction endonuclease family protein, partial [Geobacter sp.]
GREDRLNFGGPFRINCFHERTGLTLVLNGFDSTTGKITDTSGGITLVSKNGSDAATWHFAEIMHHWNRKHAQAVYVPSNCGKEPELVYRYGNLIRIGYGTDFTLCLKALALGKVDYDLGIKLENVSTKPKVKHRSQFRIKSADIELLYHKMKTVDLTA